VYTVLRVATEDVQSFCSNYHTQDQIVYVHLGVSGQATSVCLEEYAYNNMTFRVPDEAGFQPQQECITSVCEYDSALQSDLPLAAISAQIGAEHTIATGSETSVIAMSSDPGRYLCNYIYYHSLQHFAQKSQLKHCVFIHVPPVEVMSLETQIKVVSQCVRLIREHCTSENNVGGGAGVK
jgi:pyroglutamyl-peptidase